MTECFAEYVWLPQGWGESTRFRIEAGALTEVDESANGAGVNRIGRFVLPGMPNLHSHAFQRAMAGLAEKQWNPQDNFWSWRETMYAFAGRVGPDDLRAIAVYLKDLPAQRKTQQTASNDKDALDRGRLLYVDQCAGCHMENGEGVPGVFPPIKDNSGVHAHDPTSLARLVLGGARSTVTPAKPEGFAMPAFDWKLTDAEVADLLTYIRASFGNNADPVKASKVADVRKSIRGEGGG